MPMAPWLKVDRIFLLEYYPAQNPGLGTTLVEHQSVNVPNYAKLRRWNASQLVLGHFRCSIWRRKGCNASFGWVFGFQLDSLEKNLTSLPGFTFTEFSDTEGTCFFSRKPSLTPKTQPNDALQPFRRQMEHPNIENSNWLPFHRRQNEGFWKSTDWCSTKNVPCSEIRTKIFCGKSDSKISIHHDPFSRTPRRVWFLLNCYNFGWVMTFW